MPDCKRCVIIPALKKKAVIPDQLVKKLAGVTLMERAIQTARGVVAGEDVIVLTDSQEISLMCERSGVRFYYNAALNVDGLDIVHGLRSVLMEVASGYTHVIVYRASCPLITWVDIEGAWQRFIVSQADCLVTVKSVRQRMWEERGGTLDSVFCDDTTPVFVESKSLIMLTYDAICSGNSVRTIPYVLTDRAIEINSYQDWWICERLLKRRHIVFVVAGYPAIGMGHIYRALMLAHEIADHKISFVCTKQSELAVTSITAKDYQTVVQRDDLATEVLQLRPDLVINDILNTDAAYIQRLQAEGVRVVNFEDEGSGAAYADLVINALYETRSDDPRICCGPAYFCLRDEFVSATRNIFRPQVRTVLITFGGTDILDMSRRVLDCIEPECFARGIVIRLVSGPGYAHKQRMQEHVAALHAAGHTQVEFTHVTNVMSRMMEGVDLAICSAGRTLYELAHMRIPAMVLAQHEREAEHTFGRVANGFAYLGIVSTVTDAAIRQTFRAMLAPAPRERFFVRQAAYDFSAHKPQVVAKLLALLENESE